MVLNKLHYLKIEFLCLYTRSAVNYIVCKENLHVKFSQREEIAILILFRPNVLSIYVLLCIYVVSIQITIYKFRIKIHFSLNIGLARFSAGSLPPNNT